MVRCLEEVFALCVVQNIDGSQTQVYIIYILQGSV
jgi:hypothetical protein